MTPTISARSMGKILDALRRAGAGTEPPLARARLRPEWADHPDRRVPHASILRLYETAAAELGSGAFGLAVGGAAEAGAFDVLGYAVANSPTIGVAVDRLVRYHAVWCEGSGFTLTHAGRTVRLAYAYPWLHVAPAERRHECEATLACIVSIGRALAGADWQPLAVSFEHPRPERTDAHAALFRAPVRFAAGENALVLPRELLDLPVRRADLRLGEVLVRQAERLLPARSADAGTVSARARAALAPLLPGGEASARGVARALHLSVRSLQRHLAAEGTSLQRLADELRRELALRYLAGGGMGVGEVAYLLGFSEPSALQRAFRRWTGESPGAYRRRVSALPAA